MLPTHSPQRARVVDPPGSLDLVVPMYGADYDPADRSHIIRLGSDLIVFPTHDGFGPKCVARLKRGGRCQGIVWPGGSWNPAVIIPGRGEVHPLHAYLSDAEEWLRQRCERHIQEDAPDEVAPEWVPFDPDAHHHLIRPFEYTWTSAGVIGWTHPPLEFSVARPVKAKPITEPEPVTEPEPIVTALYRYFDEDDRLLYVGITKALRTRTAQHASRSSWSEFSVRSTITRYPTRREAEDAERLAIVEEKPLFNWQHADAAEASARLVAYLVDKGRLDLLAPSVSRG